MTSNVALEVIDSGGVGSEPLRRYAAGGLLVPDIWSLGVTRAQARSALRA